MFRGRLLLSGVGLAEVALSEVAAVLGSLGARDLSLAALEGDVPSARLSFVFPAGSEVAAAEWTEAAVADLRRCLRGLILAAGRDAVSPLTSVTGRLRYGPMLAGATGQCDDQGNSSFDHFNDLLNDDSGATDSGTEEVTIAVALPSLSRERARRRGQLIAAAAASLICSLSAACGSSPSVPTAKKAMYDVARVVSDDKKPPISIDPKIQGYIVAYEEQAAANDIPINPGHLLRVAEFVDEFPLVLGATGDTLAICVEKSSSLKDASGHHQEISVWRQIFVRKPSPDNFLADEGYMRWTVFHELGHCLSNLGHDTDPNDIMSASVDDSAVNITDPSWQVKIDQLFNSAYMASLPRF